MFGAQFCKVGNQLNTCLSIFSSRQAGHRLCNHINRIMVLLEEYSQREDDELREFCIQAWEAFVQRCPDAIKEHIPAVSDRMFPLSLFNNRFRFSRQIVKLCLNYITYDPNYNYEADEGDAGGNFMDTEEEEYAGSEEYSDDDDMSWKVRRSAAKCLEAVISTRHELLEDFYRTLSPALIARFKEREENVKSDIFHAYIALLKSTRPHDELANPDSMDEVPSPIQLLQDQVPNIVTAIQPLMGDKSIKTRQDCFLLLRELLNALPGGLSNNFEQLMPGIQYSLSDKNSSSNMKIDALGFIYYMLQSHSPQVFQPHIPTLVPLVVSSVFDPFYKIATEALLVLQHMVKVIRPLSKCIDRIVSNSKWIQMFSCHFRFTSLP